ncbi:hypothetical protein CYMTET_53042, partial [Cymbomonas tetramitiformis]
SFGQAWRRMWVDAEVVELAWTSIPDGRWAFVHLEVDVPFTDDVNIMSRAASGAVSGSDLSCLRGDVAEIFLWGRPLLQREVDVVAAGFDYLLEHNSYASLLAAFAMEEGAGAFTRDAFGPNGLAALVNGPVWQELVPLQGGWRPYSRDHLELPELAAIHGISLWVKIAEEQPFLNDTQYLLHLASEDNSDLTYASGLGTFKGGAHEWVSGVATAIPSFNKEWAAMYVEGERCQPWWAALPLGAWAHVHLEPVRPFTTLNAALTLMGRAPGGDLGAEPGGLHGWLAAVALWDRHLRESEVRQLANSQLYLDAGCAYPPNASNSAVGAAAAAGRWAEVDASQFGWEWNATGDNRGDAGEVPAGASTCDGPGLVAHYPLEAIPGTTAGETTLGVVRDMTGRSSAAVVSGLVSWSEDSPQDGGWTSPPPSPAPLPPPPPPSVPPLSPATCPAAPLATLSASTPNPASTSTIAPTELGLDIEGWSGLVHLTARFAEGDATTLSRDFGEAYVGQLAAVADGPPANHAIESVVPGSIVVGSWSRFSSYKKAVAFEAEVACCFVHRVAEGPWSDTIAPLGVLEVLHVKATYVANEALFPEEEADIKGSDSLSEQWWVWVLLVLLAGTVVAFIYLVTSRFLHARSGAARNEDPREAPSTSPASEPKLHDLRWRRPDSPLEEAQHRASFAKVFPELVPEDDMVEVLLLEEIRLDSKVVDWKMKAQQEGFEAWKDRSKSNAGRDGRVTWQSKKPVKRVRPKSPSSKFIKSYDHFLPKRPPSVPLIEVEDGEELRASENTMDDVEEIQAGESYPENVLDHGSKAEEMEANSTGPNVKTSAEFESTRTAEPVKQQPHPLPDDTIDDDIWRGGTQGMPDIVCHLASSANPELIEW